MTLLFGQLIFLAMGITLLLLIVYAHMLTFAGLKLAETRSKHNDGEYLPYRHYSDEALAEEYIDAVVIIRDATERDVYFLHYCNQAQTIYEEWQRRGNKSWLLAKKLRDAGVNVSDSPHPLTRGG